MAKRKLFNLNYTQFNELLTEFDGLGGEMKPVVTKELEEAAKTVERDTIKAMEPSNLPAHGKYSRNPSKTKQSIVRNAKVEWSGTTASVGIGFDFSKPGAGGFLITGYYRSSEINGTARMEPNIELQRIYGGWAKGHNRYKREIQENMAKVVRDAINKKIGGKNGK